MLPSICFVAPNAYPLLSGDDRLQVIGGAELQQVLLARELAGRGYPVVMICWDFGQQDEKSIDGIRVLKACRPGEGVPGLRFFYPRLASIWSCLQRANADIYYQRTAGFLTGVVAEYGRRTRRKSIFAAAGNPDLFPKTPRIRFARDRWIYEHGLRHVDLVVVQNDEQKRLSKLNYGREAVLIPNCYTVPIDTPARSRSVILWVSTIKNIKQPGLFLELAQAFPDIRFRMVGGPGSGAQALYESIRKRALAMPNVEFTGFVPYAKVEEHFDDALMFINTSESEGFPNTFLQAWARGVPSISFVDCGARVAGKTVGRVVGSMSEMIACVRQWLENDLELADAGGVCRAYVEGRHSTSKVVDMYEGVFAELLSRRFQKTK